MLQFKVGNSEQIIVSEEYLSINNSASLIDAQDNFESKDNSSREQWFYSIDFQQSISKGQSDRPQVDEVTQTTIIAFKSNQHQRVQVQQWRNQSENNSEQLNARREVIQKLQCQKIEQRLEKQKIVEENTQINNYDSLLQQSQDGQQKFPDDESQFQSEEDILSESEYQFSEQQQSDSDDQEYRKEYKKKKSKSNLNEKTHKNIPIQKTKKQSKTKTSNLKVKIFLSPLTTTQQSAIFKVKGKTKNSTKKDSKAKRKNKITSQQYSVFNYIESYFN